jgi:hypothetical protein
MLERHFIPTSDVCSDTAPRAPRVGIIHEYIHMLTIRNIWKRKKERKIQIHFFLHSSFQLTS